MSRRDGDANRRALCATLNERGPSWLSYRDGRRWTLALDCRDVGGHSYWRDAAGRIYVADASMRLEARPDTTDDGLLELVGYDARGLRLTSAAGGDYGTAAGPCELRRLARRMPEWFPGRPALARFCAGILSESCPWHHSAEFDACEARSA